jgi:rRNA maturation endonuclease Nob1
MGSRNAKSAFEESPIKRVRKSVRICRSCGKNAHPNYFYCPACHHKISHRGDPEDVSSGGYSTSHEGSHA